MADFEPCHVLCSDEAGRIESTGVGVCTTKMNSNADTMGQPV